MNQPAETELPTAPTAVAKPPNPWVLPLGVGAVVAAGVMVFAAMSSNRAEKQAAPAASAVFDPPPPPIEPMIEPDAVVSADDPPAAPHMMGLNEAPPEAERALPGLGAATMPDQARRAPALIVDLSGPIGAPGAAPAAVPEPMNPATVVATDAKGDSDNAFARRVSSEAVGTAQSSRIARPDLTAPQGTMVPAVLETAINSDLPGFARAVVSRDVRAFDGSSVVIPRGSKLVGQYRNAVAAGQSRAFVVWTRLIRPDGVTIDLGSPGADALGRGGLEGQTDRHFLQRFGAAILLSVITAAAVGDNDRDVVVIGSAQDAGRIAEIALRKQIDIQPTIKVLQGTPIRVFVAKDLVFESAARR